MGEAAGLPQSFLAAWLETPIICGMIRTERKMLYLFLTVPALLAASGFWFPILYALLPVGIVLVYWLRKTSREYVAGLTPEESKSLEEFKFINYP